MIVNIRNSIFIFLCVIFSLNFALAQSTSDQLISTDNDGYKFSPGDVISVTVFGEPDISVSSMRVPFSGVYNYPLIGELELVNQTVKSLAKTVEAKLRAGFLSDPKVSVNIVRYRPVIVTGSVDKTGIIDYQEGMTVRILSALAQVNLSESEISNVSIQRGDVTFTPESLDSAILPGDIISYDTIVIEQTDHYFIYGEVNRSGKYKLEGDLTVEQAIIVAGGYTPFASKRKIRVRRLGSEEIIKVKLHESVQPGDVITIKKRWF